MNRRKKYIGIISLRDMGKYYKYGLKKVSKKGSYVDIINREVDYILDKFYKEEENIEIEVTIDSNVAFFGVGKVYKKQKYGMYEWYVDDQCLGDVLFDNVDKKATFIIKY